MKAITLHGPGDVRVESVADPRIVDPTDAVLRITTSAVCGSDLHQYHGRVAGLDPGVVMGHEFMGVVEEVGPHGGPQDHLGFEVIVDQNRVDLTNLPQDEQERVKGLFKDLGTTGFVIGPGHYYVDGILLERIGSK